jgi:hypothetical protein
LALARRVTCHSMDHFFLSDTAASGAGQGQGQGG